MTEHANLGSLIRQGTKWLVVGQAGAQVLQFLFGMVLARLLTPADFGLLVTIQIFTGLAGFISGGGLNQALIQSKNITERDYQIAFSLQLSVGLLIYIVFFVIAPWFATWFDNPLYKTLLMVSALTFVMRPFVSNPNIRLQRAMEFKAIAISNSAALVISGITSIVLAALGYGVWSLILAGIVGSLSNIVALAIASPWRPRLRLDIARSRELSGYGAKSTIGQLLWHAISETPNFIITRVLGPAPLGLYNKATSLRQIPHTVIGGPTYQTIFRALSQVQDNDDKTRYIFFRTVTILTVYVLPIYVLLWWLAEPALYFLFGSQWTEAATPLRVLALTGVCTCLSIPASAVIAARNKLQFMIRIQIETLALTAITCIIAIRWGIQGVAWATTLNLFYSTLRLSSVAQRQINGKVRDFLVALTPGATMNVILLAWLISLHELAFSGVDIHHSITYFLTMAITGGLVYVVLFLYAPVPVLASESLRWRRFLRLASQASAEPK